MLPKKQEFWTLQRTGDYCPTAHVVLAADLFSDAEPALSFSRLQYDESSLSRGPGIFHLLEGQKQQAMGNDPS
jgi:hypothetical protein